MKDAFLLEEVHLNLQQLRSMMAEANRRHVPEDNSLPLDPPTELPEGIPRSGKEETKKSWTQTEMPTISLGAASISPAYLTAALEENLSSQCPGVPMSHRGCCRHPGHYRCH